MRIISAMLTLALVSAPPVVSTVVAQCPPDTLGRSRARDSAFHNALPPSDSSFHDAEALQQILTQHGFVVHCVFRSILATMGKDFGIGLEHEAAFLTSRGSFEVLFFPGPDSAERVRVKEVANDRCGWGYFFLGTRRLGKPHPDTVCTGPRRSYLVKVRRWFIMMDDSALAADVRQALQQR